MPQETSRQARVGLIGLGIMGSAYAANLIKLGFEGDDRIGRLFFDLRRLGRRTSRRTGRRPISLSERSASARPTLGAAVVPRPVLRGTPPGFNLPGEAGRL